MGDAAGREAALQLIEEHRPEVALLDCWLPGLSGAEVAAKVWERGLPTRVLALSAYDDERYVWGMLEAGATGYLLKEEASETILAAVRGAARGEGYFSSRVAVKAAAWTRGERPAGLTEREVEVLRLAAKGLSNKEIAHSLGIKERTVEFHVGKMKGLNKRILVIGVLIAVVLSAAIFSLATTRPARSDETGLISSPDDSYEYAILREPGKPAEVIVNSPQSAKEWERYRIANLRRAKALIESGRAERLRVTITFAQPIPLAEGRALLDAARVEEVESYTMAGYDGQGQKMGSGGFGPLPASMQEVTEISPGSNIKGLIVVNGYVWTTPDSLGRLLEEPRVYIADVTEYELRQLVPGEEIEVSLPSPFWDLW